MGRREHITLSFAARLVLAAMVLMLPMLAFVTILVKDRDEQIRAAENEIAGIDYLVDLRYLLELVPRHRTLLQVPGADPEAHAAEVLRTERSIDRAFDQIAARARRAGDPFRVLDPVERVRRTWQDAKTRDRAGAFEGGLPADMEIVGDLVALFRHVGNTSNLAIDASLESTYLTNLVVNELPRMVARLGVARSRTLDIVERGGVVTPGDANDLGVDDWALTLAHDNLFYGFNVAVAEDPEIAGNLAIPFEEFDRDTYSFHAIIASGEIGEDPGRILALGDSSITATLRLFDQIVPELRRVLENRVADLRNTRKLAILTFVLATVVAGIAGWLLVRAMTRPLEAEIAERRSAEARLRDLATIVEQSEDSILTISPDGKFRSWNAGAERLYGYAAEEVIGRKVGLLAPVGYEKESEALIRRSIAGEKLPAQETVRLRKDGSLVDVSLRLSALRNDDGGVVGTAIIARDISLQKQAEAELVDKEQTLQLRVAQLRRTQDELREHRDRLEDRVRTRTAEVHEKALQLEGALQNEKEFNALQRKFVSMASHEFRTPLAIIDGAAQRIERRIDTIEPGDLAARVSRIRAAVARMLQLIEGTLSASRIDEGRVEVRWQPVDLGALVRTVCERQREVTDALDVAFDLAGLPETVAGDPALLDQVFTNLVSNAVKYSPEAPRIRITGGHDGRGRAILAVADRGVGIPADELPRLFERFFRASTSGGVAGTGIGLHLTRELVGLHGGEIAVASEVGAGTTFTVHLPVARADAGGTESPAITNPTDTNPADTGPATARAAGAAA